MSIQELDSPRTAWLEPTSTMSMEDRPRIQRGDTRLRSTGNISGLVPPSARSVTIHVLEGVRALIQHHKQHKIVGVEIGENEPIDIAGTIRRLLESPGPGIAGSAAASVASTWQSMSRLHDLQSFQEELAGIGLSYDLPWTSFSESLETVDWELQIESPPSRPSRTVMVKFEKGSYRPPRIVANPEE